MIHLFILLMSVPEIIESVHANTNLALAMLVDLAMIHRVGY